VDFVEYDVSRDRDALEELLEVYRSQVTPTIVIGDYVLVGFDPEQLDDLLAAP
jgi:hypothetical protein